MTSLPVDLILLGLIGGGLHAGFIVGILGIALKNRRGRHN